MVPNEKRRLLSVATVLNRSFTPHAKSGTPTRQAAFCLRASPLGRGKGLGVESGEVQNAEGFRPWPPLKSITYAGFEAVESSSRKLLTRTPVPAFSIGGRQKREQVQVGRLTRALWSVATTRQPCH
jgi:hypothetical protein